MIIQRHPSVVLLLIFLATIVVLGRNLSVHGVEYRDDEIFYYRSAQEMVASGDYLSPKYFGEDRFQKPALYYWFITLAYGLFGINWFSARIVSVVFAGLSLCLTWLFARDLFGRRVAFLSTLILSTVPMFFRHARNAVPDMALNFFVVLALYLAWRFLRDGVRKDKILFFVACALGFMVKGFAALIVPVGTVVVYCCFRRDWKGLKSFSFGKGLFVILLIVAPWFFYMMYKHGFGYFDYMWSQETMLRLIGYETENVLWYKIRTFGQHVGFYLLQNLTFFAPWSLFFFLFSLTGGGFLKKNIPAPTKQTLQFLWIWCGVVYLFFSSMYYLISHYLLVFSSAFAILVAYFLVEETVFPRLKKYIFLALCCLTILAFGFLLVFFVGEHTLWLAVCLGAIAVVAGLIVRSQDPLTAPVVFACCMLFVISQPSLLQKAGIARHTTLQKFASVIQDDDPDYVVGVGSNDLHEKEFQVYFDGRQVIRAAHSYPVLEERMLTVLFTDHKKVYCLVQERDYQKYLKGKVDGVKIVKEAYGIRRRFYLDGGVFTALIHNDREKIRDYFKERILLVKKG